MSDYKATIGLEIHAELKTQTKMFCDSKNDPDEERPNHNICPICMGHPGTLPVINREAVRQVLRVGTAAGGTIADYTEFDRKNYFYPDIPKGYQISQYKYPLISGGSIHGVELTRIHLEEDTASSTHDSGDFSLVDFNRAGVPLMELVTEPVIHSAEEAGAFARELRLLLRYLGASDANMEKGEMRVEANISISKTEEFGTKVEVKNLNSFKAVEKAIAYEIKRHEALLEKGEKVVQETRGWDEAKQSTFSQRKKENSHDYRYFPDPDLPKLKISEIDEFSVEALQTSLPELPWDARERLIASGVALDTASVLVGEPLLKVFFDAVTKEMKEGEKGIKLSANYLTSDVLGLVSEGVITLEILEARSPSEFASLIALIESGDLSSRGAKDTLKLWISEGGSPKVIAEEHGLIQKSDPEELKKLITQIIEENPEVVGEVKNGNEKALKFLVGQGMKLSKGSANPGLLTSELEKALL